MDYEVDNNGKKVVHRHDLLHDKKVKAKSKGKRRRSPSIFDKQKKSFEIVLPTLPCPDHEKKATAKSNGKRRRSPSILDKQKKSCGRVLPTLPCPDCAKIISVKGLERHRKEKFKHF